jgi:hypothetical protein
VERTDAGPAVEYLAECLWPGVTETELAELDARVRSRTVGERDRSDDVRYLGSTLMPGDEVVFFVFTGPSASAVEEVAASVRIPFERIVESVRLSGSSEREEQ